ncbi:fungal-specific transcription factor domain-containing protein [Aspergillus ambiguus]|uniref:fungal specific transcription factor domain-containing protein n=1 Tax=Aspergillus ambiguus TaxID=176160 RepID=UPI003CCD1339
MQPRLRSHKACALCHERKIKRLLLLRRLATRVLPIYPLFPVEYMTILESLSHSDHPQENGDTTVIFYLVMSIGAIHAEQTHLLNDLQNDVSIHAYRNAFAKGLSAEALYHKALDVLDTGIQNLASRVALVQILNLISIYASHRPSDNKQWHIGGIAIRLAIELGLHRHNDNWKFPAEDLELRRRVFWTTYAIEITLAFNLGRPASISFEDADAPFPEATGDMVMPIHHFRHRQIQEQMLSQVYRGRKSNMSVGVEGAQSVLDKLQDQLDRWHQELHELHAQSTSPYPVEYWDRLYYSTSAALSRPTPLVPRPAPQAHERCFMSSGRVIEIHEQLIRQFRLPNSWMLLQGLTLSAVSMIVTARTNAVALSKRIGFDSLLDRVSLWVRKLSVVMAIMRERWPAFGTGNLEDLLDKISRDTVRRIINIIANEQPTRPSSLGRTVADTTPSLLPTSPSHNDTPCPDSVPIDHMHYTMLHGAGTFIGRATDQHTSSAQPDIGDGFLGFDSDPVWGSFDNLFETDALQSFFGLFSGQEYI